jgi:predicted amidohydrolase
MRVTEAGEGDARRIAALQARWDVGGVGRDGARVGAARGGPTVVRAPAGHALGGIVLRGGDRVHGFRPVWFPRKGDALDRSRAAIGPWVGGRGGTHPVRLGLGLPVAGLHGWADGEVSALGLVLRVPGGTRAARTVRVAAVQSPSDLGEVERNAERLSRLVEEAAAGGAKVVVLPECAVSGYLSQDLETTWHVPGRPRAEAFAHGRDPATAAEPVPGPSTARFAALAKRLGVWISVPLLEVVRAADGGARYFNTLVLVSPAGEVAAHYRKVNPWPHPEQSWAERGDLGLVVAETEWGRVGLAVCYDVHEVFPGYAEKGIWALLYSVAWVSGGDDEEWFGTELPRRAREAGFHVVAANWSVDRPQPWHGHGFSRVISKDGAVLAAARTRVGSEIVYADLPVAPR